MADQPPPPTAEELATENAKLRAQSRAVALRAAFDRDNDHRWHCDDDAFQMLQTQGYLDAVKVHDDGSVDHVAVRTAVRAFARENAYFVDSESEIKKPIPPFPSGGNVGGGRKRYGPPIADEAALRKKYPALNH